MDPVIAKLVENAPTAVAIIIVVAYFLRAQKDIITQFQESMEKERSMWKNIIDAQREAFNQVASQLRALTESSSTHAEKLDTLIDNQNKIITRKMRAVKK